MEKLYTKTKTGNHRPTQLHKDLGVKVGKVIDNLFTELIDEGLDIIEAKYVIDSCTSDITLNNLLALDEWMKQ
jgi:hypothetical protein